MLCLWYISCNLKYIFCNKSFKSFLECQMSKDKPTHLMRQTVIFLIPVIFFCRVFILCKCNYKLTLAEKTILKCVFTQNTRLGVSNTRSSVWMIGPEVLLSGLVFGLRRLLWKHSFLSVLYLICEMLLKLYYCGADEGKILICGKKHRASYL